MLAEESRSRVSQLLGALERRVGGRLVARSSRRVELTPLGETFLAELRPTYERLLGIQQTARAVARGVSGTLRIAFQGTADAGRLRALAAFEEARPGVRTDVGEIPFGALRRGEADAAVVLLPVAERDLVVGPRFPPRRKTVAVSVRHPFAGREAVTAEEVAGVRLVGPGGPAPGYRRRAQAPTEVAGGPCVGTLREGLSLVAAGRGAMLLCRATAGYQGRGDVVWRRDRDSAAVRAFARAVAGAA